MLNRHGRGHQHRRWHAAAQRHAARRRLPPTGRRGRGRPPGGTAGSRRHRRRRRRSGAGRRLPGRSRSSHGGPAPRSPATTESGRRRLPSRTRKYPRRPGLCLRHSPVGHPVIRRCRARHGDRSLRGRRCCLRRGRRVICLVIALHTTRRACLAQPPRALDAPAGASAPRQRRRSSARATAACTPRPRTPQRRAAMRWTTSRGAARLSPTPRRATPRRAAPRRDGLGSWCHSSG